MTITVEMLMWTLLLLLGLLIFLVLVLGIAIKSSLTRIEHRLTPQPGRRDIAGSRDTSADDGRSQFKAFLSEDPSRIALSKSEQSAAFREWRRQKGMSWSNS